MRHGGILLVEDNPDDETMFLRSLQKSGVSGDVVVKRDGQAAVDYLLGSDPAGRSEEEAPLVVFLDLKLPKLDGLEVLQRLRAESRTKLQPVVILTSSDELQDRNRSYALGANSYVCKPVDSGDFDEAVDRIGEYWTRLNKPPKD